MPFELLKTVASVMVAAQLSFPETTPHFPLLDVSVKPVPEEEAVKVAHVPVVYHVPPLMIQPTALPSVVTCSVPLPEKGVPGLAVGPGGAVPVGVVVVVVGAPLGRYLIPVEGQEFFSPSGFVAIKVPVCAEPRTT